jgi:D-alanyl-D-alanine carboxypeptidase/D-alanyl-D-alanine-endopeptidase (penicillin-binding protein 4)
MNAMKFYTVILTVAMALLYPTMSAAVTLSFPGKQAATVGLAVVDIATGNVVESENYQQAMIPASILKSLTSATVLSKVDRDFRFETQVILSGKINGSTLDGDIIVKASGDPTIDSRHFPDNAGFVDSIVAHVKTLDIKRITGDLLVDEERYPDTGQNPQWVIEDVGWDYGAGWYGFNFMDNTFKLYPATMKTVPEVPDIDVMVEPGVGEAEVLKGVNSDNYIVSGGNVDSKQCVVSTTMNSPARVFANILRQRLQAIGVTVDGGECESSGDEIIIYVHRSPRMIDILHSLMVRSDNMMAEGVLRSTAAGTSRSNAIKKELNFWNDKGASTQYVRVCDGSGLARADRVSPMFMAQMLVKMALSDKSADYVGLFPVAGREGTVKKILKGTRLEGLLVLKSGSMSGVHCYAGYKVDDDGKPTHAVVIMINNFFCSRNSVRQAIENWILSVFQ